MNHCPTAIGMVLCEQVIVEEGTHNVTPVNCFNHRKLAALPGRVSFFALAWLADGEGELTVDVVVEKLDTLEEVHRFSRKLTFPDRLQELRCLVKINCDFPIAGRYQVSLIMDHELVAHRKFRIHT